MRIEPNKNGQRWVLSDLEAQIMDYLRDSAADANTFEELQQALNATRAQLGIALRRLRKYGLVRSYPKQRAALLVWQAWRANHGWPNIKIAEAKYQNECRIHYSQLGNNLPRVRQARKREGTA